MNKLRNFLQINKKNKQSKKLYHFISKVIIIIILILILYYIFYIHQNFYNSNQIILDTGFDNNQGFHPKVLYFPKFWNGYNYWMAFTPYPDSDCTKENPTINVSNDLINWFTPKGLINPLDRPSNPDNSHYNSDTHLTYNYDSKKLEIFWRYYNKINNTIYILIYKRETSNGIIWGKKELFLKSENRSKKDYLSPSIVYDSGIYKIWYINKGKINYIEKKGNIIKNHRILNIYFNEDYYPWHLDVIYNKKKKIYEIVLNAYYNNIRNRSRMSLFYTSSKDNISWEKPIIILKPSKNKSNWDSKRIYRSSLLYENGYYYLFYSGSNNNKNGIGLMYGKNIKHLKPYL